MSKLAFDEFVKSQQNDEREAVGPNSAQQLKEWLLYLDNLYSKITSYVQSYINEATAQIYYSNIELNEEFFGAYQARKMTLKIGRSSVAFNPVGTGLFGMRGRVDVLGPSGKASLFLVNKRTTNARSLIQVTISRPGDPPPQPESNKKREPIQWVWKIGTPPPDMNFVELTQETFFEMILEVANG